MASFKKKLWVRLKQMPVYHIMKMYIQNHNEIFDTCLSEED